MENYKLYKLLKSINSGGTDTSDATVTAADLPEGIIAYGSEGKIHGTIPDKRGYHVMGYQKKPYIPNGWSSVWIDLQPGPMIINDKSKYQITMTFKDMSDTIGLTPEKLKAGETVMEMEGTFTADADATAGDIVVGKIAYVNGEKITGNVQKVMSSGGLCYDVKLRDNMVDFTYLLNNPLLITTSYGVSVPQENIAQAVALTPDKLVKGNTILGVEGIGETGTNFKITNANHLFYENARIDYLNEFLAMCENITSAQEMFANANKVTVLDLSNLNTEYCTTMYMMFYQVKVKELDLSNFKTDNVTNMNRMFMSCGELTTLDLKNFNTSKVTDMENMFSGCSRIQNLNLSSFDTSNVTKMGYMFQSLGFFTDGVPELNLSSFDMSKVDSVGYMFSGAKLKSFKTFKNLGKGYSHTANNYSKYTLDLSWTELPHDDLIDLLNIGLYDLNLTYDVANGGTLYTQQLIIGEKNLAQLTEEEIAIATNKGWTVS